jgi:diguanylate cyclase (GGDEF)-like protein
MRGGSDQPGGMPTRFRSAAFASAVVAGPGSSDCARARMGRAAAWMFAAGALTLALVLLTPSTRGAPDRTVLALCAVVCGVIAVVLAPLRSLPEWTIHLLVPGGTILVAVVLWAADPVTVAPSCFVLPLLLAAYFLPTREVVANLALAGGVYVLALARWIDSANPVQEFLTVASVACTATVLIVTLRAQVHTVIDELQTLATRDGLTGALNRVAFEHRLQQELARAARAGAPCSLVMLDIDHFKAINDEHGHASGDEALRWLADEVRTFKRGADAFGRIGGEEFALILPDTDLDGAEAFAERLRARLARRGIRGGGAITVSIGVAGAATRVSAGEIFGAADRALYAAKTAGRDRVARADGGPALRVDGGAPMTRAP